MAVVSLIPPKTLIVTGCFRQHSSWGHFSIFIMPLVFGDSHSTRWQSMLWVEILLAWNHLEYFFEENATSFCLSIQMICLLKVDQRLVNFCSEDLSWSPEMDFASRPLNQCRWPLSPKFMTWLILYKVSMVFSFSDCGSAVLEWIRRASSLEPHEDTKVEISPKIRSYRPDLIMMTWYFALLTWLYTF